MVSKILILKNMEEYKIYLLEELKRCDQKLQKFDDIQMDLVKFYFATVFTISTIVIALINYKIYNNTNTLLTWFLLLPLLLFGFVVWFSLKKILIQYEYYESIRNEISQIFLKLGAMDYKFQFFNSPFKYFYSLISWLFVINLFAFLYSAIPLLSRMAVSMYVVMAVAILVTLVLFSLATIALNSARKKARDAKRVSDIKQIQTALELYYNDHDNYPIAGDIERLSEELSKKDEVYMSNIPKDPKNDSIYGYTYKSDDGNKYEIKFRLEEGGDKIANPTGIHNTAK
jgi:type II secretory pathway pseudopilin PulG